MPGLQDGWFEFLLSAVRWVAKISVGGIVPELSHEAAVDTSGWVLLGPAMTQSTVVVGAVLLDVGNITTDEHINAHVDTNLFTECCGEGYHIQPQTFGNIRQWVTADIQSLDGSHILCTSIKINIVTNTVGLFRSTGFEATVLVQPFKVGIEFGITGTIGTLVVDGRDGTNLTIKDMEFVFRGERERTAVAGNELFDENLGGWWSEGIEIGKDIHLVVDSTTEEFDVAESIG
mmetsp:Transcript_25374/g.43192  ORF Transcript_25374/g.43192 Transcript_25374/m.43192 type:complete len:232 (-) Transcript_25374:378-1073(-)